jgi:hypothetical protein
MLSLAIAAMYSTVACMTLCNGHLGCDATSVPEDSDISSRAGPFLLQGARTRELQSDAGEYVKWALSAAALLADRSPAKAALHVLSVLM